MAGMGAREAREGSNELIRVGLAHTTASYAGLAPPYDPGARHPELESLLDGPSQGPPNHVYTSVRLALQGLGLDRERQGTSDWNPLGELVKRGGSVVLKPNFIRHWNPTEGEGASVESVITHGSILRVMVDYALLAVGREGSVTVAEAPQQDCDFERIREIAGLDALVAHVEGLGRHLEVIDLRREAVRFEDHVVAERRSLPGDPAGYRALDLGRRSFFEASGLDPARFRGADYDPGPTAEHHRDGRNEYLLSETVLSADLVVNLPKLKTHKKTGVTLAIKNLVGINGDKNWLPHHSLGPVAEGGDEFPDARTIDRLRSRATEIARPILARGRMLKLFGLLRRVENAARGEDFIRAGNWYGNQTTWRMCCDLNRCLYYSDAKGFHLDASEPVRRVLSVIDGIVAGEGEGPLAPTDVPLGAIVASLDPVAADLVAVRLMGFDARRIPKIQGAMRDDGPRITAVRSPDDVVVGVARTNEEGAGEPQDRRLDELQCSRVFLPHTGWRGHIEGERA
jgi:uncharacterized protein (DUF362 family)